MRELILLGGGHSHAIVLRMMARRSFPPARVTLVSDVNDAPYSGMLPGLIAGAYRHEEAHIDLPKLARFAGAAFVRSEAIGLDLDGGRVLLQDRAPLRFDLLSINTGSHPALEEIPGAREFAVPAKPVPQLLAWWQRVLARHRENPVTPLSIAVIGGGAGGVELALSMRAQLPRPVEIHLVQKALEILPEHHRHARQLLTRALLRKAVRLHTGERVTELRPQLIRCASGLEIEAKEIVGVTHAAAPAWISAAGLAVDDDGFLLTDSCLQSISHSQVFAAGDVATMAGTPRPKSGVFAVRAGPPLYRNLRRTLGAEPPAPYHPQKQYLSLIGTGDGEAVGSRGCFAWRSPLLWRLKQWIDRRFMRQFDV